MNEKPNPFKAPHNQSPPTRSWKAVAALVAWALAAISVLVGIGELTMRATWPDRFDAFVLPNAILVVLGLMFGWLALRLRR